MNEDWKYALVLVEVFLKSGRSIVGVVGIDASEYGYIDSLGDVSNIDDLLHPFRDDDELLVDIGIVENGELKEWVYTIYKPEIEGFRYIGDYEQGKKGLQLIPKITVNLNDGQTGKLIGAIESLERTVSWRLKGIIDGIETSRGY